MIFVITLRGGVQRRKQALLAGIVMGPLPPEGGGGSAGVCFFLYFEKLDLPQDMGCGTSENHFSVGPLNLFLGLLPPSLFTFSFPRDTLRFSRTPLRLHIEHLLCAGSSEDSQGRSHF